MTITFSCIHCGKQLSVSQEMAGKKGRCNQCSTVNLIPAMNDPGILPSSPVMLNEPASAPVQKAPPSFQAQSQPGTQANKEEVLKSYMTDESWRKNDQSTSSQMRSAKWTMIGVGLLTVIANAILLPIVLADFDKQIDEARQEAVRDGFEIDESVVAKNRQSVRLTTFLIAFGSIAIGLTLITCGVLLNKYPIPMSITALASYGTSLLVFAVVDPSSIARGIIFKVLIIAVLVKAVHAAFNGQQPQRPTAKL